MTHAHKALFIVFGGSGDLAYRKLYPALYRLYSKGFLKENFAVIGTARRPWTDKHYQDIVMDSIADIKISNTDAENFSKHFRYQSHNVNDSENYQTLLELMNELDEEYQLNGNRIFYLSVSPTFFGTIASNIKNENLYSSNGCNRLIIEKPFGHDLESAIKLNNELKEGFLEKDIYRIDHYLGKEMIQSLSSLRFFNPLIKKIWNKNFIDHFQISLSEDIGVEDRGAYYEQSGALRDMVQNHILQIIAILLMEEPATLTSPDIIKEKVNILNNLETITEKNVQKRYIKGQYKESKLYPGVIGYQDEKDVKEASEVETYVAGEVNVNLNIWDNVPVYFRTGKRMKKKDTQIDVVFKNNLKNVSPNILSIHVGPEEKITFQLNNKSSDHKSNLDTIELASNNKKNTPEDYERLILSVLEGKKSNFVHWEEVKASWKYIDKIKNSWKLSNSKLYPYLAFTNGPKESINLIKEHSTKWYADK